MRSVICALAATVLVGSAVADTLYNNGPFVTNPTGGTGTIAGLPISNPDPFTFPGVTGTFYTTGVAATVATNTAAAEDFTVPAGETWDLGSVTLYAFQTGQTTATVHHIHINLWTAPPFDAGSPPQLPDPLPQPVLASPLIIPAGTGVFVCHRQGSATSTSTTRPVFAYTVSLDGLPNGGRLGPGTYWLEWSFDGALSPSSNVFQPLVSPRTARTGQNARLKNSLDGSTTGPIDWFEGREGYSAGLSDGRATKSPSSSAARQPLCPPAAAPTSTAMAISVPTPTSRRSSPVSREAARPPHAPITPTSTATATSAPMPTSRPSSAC